MAPEAPAADRTVDLRGLACVMPVVRARLTLDLMEPGQVLCVRGAGPSVRRDLEVWARSAGNQVVAAEAEADGGFRLYVRKGRGEGNG